MERAIGAVVRYKAVEWAEYVDYEDSASGGGVVIKKDPKEYRSIVEESELEKILGIARWDGEERDKLLGWKCLHQFCSCVPSSLEDHCQGRWGL